jgi:hypothetical protein
MADTRVDKNKTFVTINVGGTEVRIEKIGAAEGALERIRLVTQNNNQPQNQLDLNEKDLAILLQRAIRAGILSVDFLSDLHADIEI